MSELPPCRFYLGRVYLLLVLSSLAHDAVRPRIQSRGLGVGYHNFLGQLTNPTPFWGNFFLGSDWAEITFC